MPLAQRIEPTTDVCQLQERWIIDFRVAEMLVLLSRRLPFGISIISGYRTPERQREIYNEKGGQDVAPVDVSTHTMCPATGVDLRVDVAVTDIVKATLGAEAVSVGFRWGGGSQVDENGIPSDWNHLDLGPRSAHHRG